MFARPMGPGVDRMLGAGRRRYRWWIVSDGWYQLHGRANWPRRKRELSDETDEATERAEGHHDLFTMYVAHLLHPT